MLLFEFHRVRGRMAAGLAGAYLASNLIGAAEMQQLPGQLGLAGIRVVNDGEGAVAGDLFFESGFWLGHGDGR